MSDILNSVPIPRRSMILCFIIDTSGSMAGTKIGALNDAISQVIPMLDDISKSNADADIKIAALQFSSGCEWIYSEPKPASDFKWVDREAGGLTDLGTAYLELNNKLSRESFLKSATGYFAPVLLLLSDGEPTDNWQAGLEKLKTNKWYQNAIKIAIAVGDDANKEILKEFTKNSEAVITVHTVEALKKLIRTVSVTASTIGSKSSTAGDKNKQIIAQEVITEVVKETDGAESESAPDPGHYDTEGW
ncbi:MAG: VWA domain-containing protein [Bacteroidales bacterium]|nr:VWA domain-containing protein [Bacteroidales bacterium]MBN2864155.1 VWA domain-containing protein [Bacteroidales bacterium]